AVHGGVQGAGGGDLRRDRVAAWRDRLLPRERRLGQAGAHAHPRAVVLQPAGDRTHGERLARRRRGRDRLERRPDHGRGRSVTFFTDANRTRAKGIVARYPRPKSAILPLAHLAQDQNAWLSPEAINEIAELTGVTTAEV